MGTLKQQRAKAQAISSTKLIESIFNFIKSIEAELIALNQKQVHEDSTDIEGEALGFYSRATEFITTNDALLGRDVRIKREGEPYDHKQKGNFLDGFYAKVAEGLVIFGSSDPKTPLILDNPNLRTTSLFGLTNDNLYKVIRQFILPFYLKHSRTLLGI